MAKGVTPSAMMVVTPTAMTPSAMMAVTREYT